MTIPTIVILPALRPGDSSCGRQPQTLARPAIVCSAYFPRMVWYNDAEQIEAARQITELPAERVILVGFSKSAPGALRVALRIPERIAGIILFDTPTPQLTPELLARWPELQSLPPMTAISRALRANLWPDTRLVLVAGAGCADSTAALAYTMTTEGVPHQFLNRSHLAHRWDSGWLDEAVSVLLDSPPGATSTSANSTSESRQSAF